MTTDNRKKILSLQIKSELLSLTLTFLQVGLQSLGLAIDFIDLQSNFVTTCVDLKSVTSQNDRSGKILIDQQIYLCQNDVQKNVGREID